MKNKIKSTSLIALAPVVLGIAPTVAAAVQYPDGGVWTYGADLRRRGAFSNYYHGSKHHSSTVISRWNSDFEKGYAGPGETSYAFMRTSIGEKMAFYYDYD
ncbi:MULTISPECIES: lactococcin 972 family bacteriocin [unclassified Streptococcus]|uniref:lactococcin 972 family bacteriocin n=1 Tax=unclassified Streptococcus TaxID=2608887 RepID=UPI0010729262|nr:MULTISPECIES: lactococcin 972 family bacteriocin [unclassified Streptococcus]MBF0788083.1 lactococcin 972 family bacteriocin [Streptococcus sp. 19428wC2_LYSM12]MCQ9211402.1 lactococcin 972 family bacteriocin [Streptococcus sp. B01]MCQ9214715.1 lactococcin 972 family bacteriocin [Streptococcus sp. O1]TFV04896.1 lactococcin 972 family bacteriocin [Streptococcus sp. LYSM12]